jgi:hypothetical protein
MARPKYGSVNDIDFTATGDHDGPGRCDVTIGPLVAGELGKSPEDQVSGLGPSIQLNNATVSGEGVLELTAAKTRAVIRPTRTSYGQDSVTLDGFLTLLRGVDDDGNHLIMEIPTLVRARLVYTRS